MDITVNQLAKGVYEISNQMNTIRLEYSRNMRYSTLDGKYHPGWGYWFNGEKHFAANKAAGMNAIFNILRSHNAFDIEGFLNHLDAKGSDIDEHYAKTIRNIVEYGLRHECLAENQLVDWLVKIIYSADIEDVVLFTNDMWLNDKYLQIKNNQYFIFKEWVMAHEIWHNETSRVDCGHKKNLCRGYRIEVSDMTGTRWLPIDLVGDETLSSHLNDEDHLDFYKENNYRPTGRIAFMGYFRSVKSDKLQDEEWELIK